VRAHLDAAGRRRGALVLYVAAAAVRTGSSRRDAQRVLQLHEIMDISPTTPPRLAGRDALWWPAAAALTNGTPSGRGDTMASPGAFETHGTL